MKTLDGEYVSLCWFDKVLFEMVRGWPGEKSTRKIIEAEACNDWSRSWKFKECYAASLQTNLSRCEGWASEIRLFDEPGRGRYKVSVLIPPNTQAHGRTPLGESVQ